MAIKTYGSISFDKEKNLWLIDKVQPHVCIKLKAMFAKIPKGKIAPFYFPNTPETCTDLLWFMERYPMRVHSLTLIKLQEGKAMQMKTASHLEKIIKPGYKPKPANLINNEKPRDYQLSAADFHAGTKRFLLGDDLGTGKTLTGILTMLNKAARPAIVCVQTHLPLQWKREIERFTNLSVHVIKQSKVYPMPSADVYIIKYSVLASWIHFFETGFFKSAIFDEVQELRRSQSDKYSGGKALSMNVEYCMGMSATPIYNYGDEIFNVIDLINPGCLGNSWDFLREWAIPIGSGKYKICDPDALGTFLRDNYFFLRRTRKDIGRELPPINKIVHTVGYDSEEVKKSDDLARMLAVTVMSGSFTERGMAARELDMLVRHQTGVAKAREVAAYVRIILENNEPVVLAGWHREVYDIWLKELEDFKPVMYTGSETIKQKEEAKRSFIAGETNLFIISLRSGIGLDGLQKRCKTVVIGELDWSPQVHNQVIGRVDRDGQDDQVTAYFPVCDYGSDPVIIDLLGLKASQAFGIMDPFGQPMEQFSDESRIKKLAESFLKK